MGGFIVLENEAAENDVLLMTCKLYGCNLGAIQVLRNAIFLEIVPSPTPS